MIRRWWSPCGEGKTIDYVKAWGCYECRVCKKRYTAKQLSVINPRLVLKAEKRRLQKKEQKRLRGVGEKLLSYARKANRRGIGLLTSQKRVS